MARIAPPVRLFAPAAEAQGGAFTIHIGGASVTAPSPNVQGVGVRSVYAGGTVDLDGIPADLSGTGDVQLGAEYIFSGPTGIDSPAAVASAVQHSKRGLLLNDYLSANYTLSLLSVPLYGSFQYTDNGSYRYGSNPAYVELDSFTYQVTDAVSTDSATFTVQDSAWVGVSVSQSIPDIDLTIDETHDMNQYISNPQGLGINTDVTGLNPSYASYNKTTKELTGGPNPGTVTDAQLVVTRLTIATIPPLTFAVGQDWDMSQYITDPDGDTISSRIIGLDTNIATYDGIPGSETLTGVSEGTMTGLQFEVTY